MNYKNITLCTLAFFMSSFVIQGILGFVIAGEYFMGLSVMREAPIVYLGFAATLLTGVALSVLYPKVALTGTPIMRGLKFGLLGGLILVPFIALDIPGRFRIPEMGTWIGVQAVLGFVHFAASGILFGLICKKGIQEVASPQRIT